MNSEVGLSNLLETDERPLNSPRSLNRPSRPFDWIKKADRDDGKSAKDFSSDEREELRKLRKKLRQVKQERDILAKATA